MAPSSLSASSLHRSHSSCVPERSARLISARLCVSCRVSPKALLAPLAQAAVRFQTAWADGCLPNQSVLLSLISIFQTSIYFPLASQDQNSAELIIKALLSSTFIFYHLLHFLWKQSWFPSFCLQLDVNAGTSSDSSLPQVRFNSTHFVYKKWSIWVQTKNASCITVLECCCVWGLLSTGQSVVMFTVSSLIYCFLSDFGNHRGIFEVRQEQNHLLKTWWLLFRTPPGGEQRVISLSVIKKKT